MDGAPRKRGRESLMQACAALTCCDAVRHPRVYVPPELQLVCVSASLAVNDCGANASHTVTSVWETAPFSGLRSSPAWRFLGFTPQCEIINLMTLLEQLLKEYTSKGSVFIQVFLSYNVGRKGGRMKKNRWGVRHPVKYGHKAKKKWAEWLPLTFFLRILMLGSAHSWRSLTVQAEPELRPLTAFFHKTIISSF